MTNLTKPRIALLHYTAPPVVGGVEGVMAVQAGLLIAAGFPTTIVAGRGATQFVETRIIPEIDSENPSNQAAMKDVGRGLANGAFAQAQDQIEKSLITALAQADIVIAHNVLTTHFNLPLTAAVHHLANKGLIKRVVVWCHDISRYVNPAAGETLRFGYPWDLLRASRPEFSYVAVSSQRQRAMAEVLQCSPEQVKVIPNGVEPSLMFALSKVGGHLANEFSLLKADLVLLMPIRITRAKNIEFAMRVVAVIKANGLSPRLVVTGPPDPHAADSGNYFSSLKELRQMLGLQREVVFIYEGTPTHPYPLTISASIVAELYRICDLVLTPSYREGFGLPVVESGLLGKPIFTTRIPALDEVGLEDDNVIGPDESPSAVAARILAWARTNVMYNRQRHIRQTLTWQSIFARHIEPLLLSLAPERVLKS